MTSLTNKIIAITGAASGIGLSTARLLAHRGAVLSLADVQSGPLSRLATEIRNDGGRCIASVVDVRDTAMVDAWIGETVRGFGGLDGAVNCAGVGVAVLPSWVVVVVADCGGGGRFLGGVVRWRG